MLRPHLLTQTPLMKRLKFTLADLDTNKDGMLSFNQRRRLEQRQHQSLFNHIVLAIGIAVFDVLWFSLPISLPSERFILQLPVGIISAVTLVVLAAHFRAVTQPLTRDIIAGKVKVVSGYLQLKDNRQPDGEQQPLFPRYVAQVDDIQFRVSRQIYEQLPQGRFCTIYYLPNTCQILSMQPVE